MGKNKNKNTRPVTGAPRPAPSAPPSNAPAPSPAAASTSNPVAGALNIAITVPEELKIEMVSASALGEYEMWFFIASVLSNGVFGFSVAYLQSNPKENSFLFMALLCLVLFVATLSRAIYLRRQLKKNSKVIKMKVAEIEVPNNGA